MRTWRIVAIALVVVSSAAGAPSPGARAGDAEGCAGLAEYRAAMLDAGRAYVEAFYAAGLGPDRDPLTFSSADWEAVARHAADFQAVLGSIQPPPFAAEWHRLEIERYGLLEGMARVIARDGTQAVAAFIVLLDANVEARADALRTATKACPDFALFERDYDLLDGGREGTPDATARPEAVPFGGAGVVDDRLSVGVLAVYRDPRAIDPTANWFINWLDANPRAEGSEFFTVRLRLTNGGREPLRASDYAVGFGAESGAVYGDAEACGTVPGELAVGTTLHPGDAVDANVCRVVRLRDVDTLAAYVEPAVSRDESQRVWFELPV